MHIENSTLEIVQDRHDVCTFFDAVGGYSIGVVLNHGPRRFSRPSAGGASGTSRTYESRRDPRIILFARTGSSESPTQLLRAHGCRQCLKPRSNSGRDSKFALRPGSALAEDAVDQSALRPDQTQGPCVSTDRRRDIIHNFSPETNNVPVCNDRHARFGDIEVNARNGLPGRSIASGRFCLSVPESRRAVSSSHAHQRPGVKWPSVVPDAKSF